MRLRLASLLATAPSRSELGYLVLLHTQSILSRRNGAPQSFEKRLQCEKVAEIFVREFTEKIAARYLGRNAPPFRLRRLTHSTSGNRGLVRVMLCITLVPLSARISLARIQSLVAPWQGDLCGDRHDADGSSVFLPPASHAMDLIVLRLVLYFLLIPLALAVAGISLAILKSLHHSTLLYVLLIPIWSSLLVAFLSVARVALRGAPGDNGH